MKTVLILALGMILWIGETHAADRDFGAVAQPDELFVVVSSGDAETQMMAMVLATQSANLEVKVRILLCSDGGDLALGDRNFPLFEPSGRSPQELLLGLMDRGVRVEVCGIYLPNRDYTEADLIDGVGAASPPEVAGYMRRPTVKYFTF